MLFRPYDLERMKGHSQLDSDDSYINMNELISPHKPIKFFGVGDPWVTLIVAAVFTILVQVSTILGFLLLPLER